METVGEIKKRLQDLGLSTSTPGLVGDERLDELRCRLESHLKGSNLTAVAETSKVLLPMNSPLKDSSNLQTLSSLSLGELRGRLAAMGESTSTPGLAGEERRLELVKRLSRAIQGEESKPHVLQPLSPLPAVVPIKSDMPESGPLLSNFYASSSAEADISETKKMLKRLANKRSIAIAAKLSSDSKSQDPLLSQCEQKITRIEVELNRVSMPANKGKLWTSDLLESNNTFSSDIYEHKLITLLENLKNEVREHRQRIKEEANNHPEYGLAEENRLNDLLKEMNLSKGRASRQISTGKPGTGTGTVAKPSTGSGVGPGTVLVSAGKPNTSNIGILSNSAQGVDNTGFSRIASSNEANVRISVDLQGEDMQKYSQIKLSEVVSPAKPAATTDFQRKSVENQIKPVSSRDFTHSFEVTRPSSGQKLSSLASKGPKDVNVGVARPTSSEKTRPSSGQKLSSLASKGPKDVNVGVARPTSSEVSLRAKAHQKVGSNTVAETIKARALTPMRSILMEPTSSLDDMEYEEEYSEESEDEDDDEVDGRLSPAVLRTHGANSASMQSLLSEITFMDDMETPDHFPVKVPVAKPLSFHPKPPSGPPVAPAEIIKSGSSGSLPTAKQVRKQTPTSLKQASKVESKDDESSDGCENILIRHVKCAPILRQAKAAEKNGQFVEADDFYCQAVEQDPTCVLSLSLYGAFLHRKQGDMHRSEAFFRRGLQFCLPNALSSITNPGIPQPLPANSRVNAPKNEELGKKPIITSAPPKHDTFTKLSHVVNLLLNYALFLERGQGDIDSAIVLYEHAIEIDPNNANVLFQYAKFLTTESSLFENKKSKRNIDELFHKALKIKPKDPLITMAYGKYLRKVGQIPKAELLYFASYQLTSNAEYKGAHAATSICNYATFLYQQKYKIMLAKYLKSPKNDMLVSLKDLLSKISGLFEVGLNRYPSHRGLLKNCKIFKREMSKQSGLEGYKAEAEQVASAGSMRDQPPTVSATVSSALNPSSRQNRISPTIEQSESDDFIVVSARSITGNSPFEGLRDQEVQESAWVGTKFPQYEE